MTITSIKIKMMKQMTESCVQTKRCEIIGKLSTSTKKNIQGIPPVRPIPLSTLEEGKDPEPVNIMATDFETFSLHLEF